jgi:hypothetical protein
VITKRTAGDYKIKKANELEVTLIVKLASTAALGNASVKYPF